MTTYTTAAIDCKGICWNDVHEDRDYLRFGGYTPSGFRTSSASKGKVTDSFDIRSKMGEQAEISVIHRDAPTLFEGNMKFDCRMAVFAPASDVGHYVGEITRVLEGKVDSMEIR
jgi:hypothetical protein